MRIYAVLMVLLGAASLGVAEASAESKPVNTKASLSVGPDNTQTWTTVERIMDTAVGNIALRYNLNREQTAYTHELMRREVTRFLKEHEEKVWPVLRDLLASQLRPPGEAKDAERIGKAALPLAELAEKAIFDANEEWRHILTEQQMEIHDFDLAEMRKTFTKIEGNLESWATGKPGDKGIFPPAEVPANNPPRPKKPPPGLPEPKVEELNISIFDTFVEQFIKDYRLDEGQIDSARSILAEFKTKATNIKDAKKHEFAKVRADLSEAISKRSPEDIRKATAEHKKLLEPVYALFAQMNTRLNGLLTTAQLEQYGPKAAPADAKPAPAEAKPKAAEGTPKAPKVEPKVSGDKPKTDGDQPKAGGDRPKAGEPKPKPSDPKKKRTTPKKPPPPKGEPEASGSETKEKES